MRKTFIEADEVLAEIRKYQESLPLMRKTFIEATLVKATLTAMAASLPLMRKTFIEACLTRSNRSCGGPSLPLMRKTFIEVGNIPACTANSVVSSIVMETFIEGRGSANLSPALVFCCLYSRLSFLMK